MDTNSPQTSSQPKSAGGGADFIIPITPQKPAYTPPPKPAPEKKLVPPPNPLTPASAEKIPVATTPATSAPKPTEAWSIPVPQKPVPPPIPEPKSVQAAPAPAPAKITPAPKPVAAQPPKPEAAFVKTPIQPRAKATPSFEDQQNEINKILGNTNPSGIAGKAEPVLSAGGNTYDSLKAANAFFVKEIPREDPSKVVNALHKENTVQVSRTIESDIEDASKARNMSPESMFITERAAELSKKREIEDPRWGLYIMITSAMLVLGGFLALGAVYLLRTEPSAPEPVLVDPSVIIVTESSEPLYTNNQPLQKLIVDLSRIHPGMGNNTIVRLVVKEGSSTSTTPVDASRFAALLTPAMPDWLSRTFKPEYLAGLYSGGQGFDPIIIFKLASYENSYAGMLKWEETMKQDLDNITQFALAKQLPPPAATSTATSTASTTSKTAKKTTKTTRAETATTTPVFENPVIKTGFRDVIIKNKDVRVLEDSSGHRLIYYSFPDKETLVITTSQAALEEVFARLITSKFVR